MRTNDVGLALRGGGDALGSMAGARVVPGGDLLLHADFARDGNDLILTGPQGQRVVVSNYFADTAPPPLATASGAQLPAELVKLLAVDGTAYAQAAAPGLGAAIGQVRGLSGTATVTHSDGTTATLQVGDPVYRSDVLRTEGGSSLGIQFADGTNFSLGAGSRMVLNELVYSPGGRGSMAVSVLQGSFVFLTGQVAKGGGNMEVRTPVATIGVRGTTVAGNLEVDGANGQFTLLPDPDGRIGVVDIVNGAGQTVLSQSFQSTLIAGFNLPPGVPLVLTPQAIQQLYGLALQSHGGLIGQPPIPQQDQQPGDRRGDLSPQELQQLGQIAPAAGGEGNDGSLVPQVPLQLASLVLPPTTLTDSQVEQMFRETFVPPPPPASEPPRPDQPMVVEPPQRVFAAPPGGGDVFGSAGDDTLFGSANADRLFGGAGDDRLDGGGGNDILDGGSGNDIVSGGTGNDTIIGGSGEGDDVYDGGADIDTVVYSSANLPIVVDLAAGTASGDPAIGNDLLSGVENVVGGAGNDVIAGDGNDNALNGGGGNDLLIGRGGNDLLTGGTGIDVAAYAGSIRDYTVLLGNGGTATVFSQAEGFDLLGSIERVRFTDTEIVIDGSNQGPGIAGLPTDTITLSGTATAHDFGPQPAFNLPSDGVPIDPDAVNGVDRAALTVQNDRAASITFLGESAGNQNVLGYYVIAADGTIGEAQIAFLNASAVGSGGNLVPGVSTVSLGVIPAGSALGFFMISNGFGQGPLTEGGIAGGRLEFRDGTAAANVNTLDSPPTLVFINANGVEETVGGTIFHSTAAANQGGEEHFVSGMLDGGLAIGIEDQPGGGDSDFNDAMFRVDIAPTQTTGPLLANLDLNDADGSLFSQAVLQLTSSTDAFDHLALSGGWSIANGQLFRPGGVATGLAASLDDTSLTLNGFASHATYEEALRAVVLVDGGAPTQGTQVAQVQVSDELGQTSTVQQGFTITTGAQDQLLAV